MYKCKNLNTYVKTFGMDANKEGKDYQSVVSFINLLGSGTTFAPLLYNFYENVLKVLDKYDYEFIKAINSYYREYFGVPFDILIIPENEKFDKEIMKDKDKPGNVFSRFSEVYAPAVMRDGTKGTGVFMKMIVKGEKS